MSRPIHISGGMVLREGGVSDSALTLNGGAIAAVGGSRPEGALHIAADGLFVLPGIVDLHGDAFERQIMPRPGVHIDYAIALADTDRQLAANGITTAYHGLTLSWEPGLRSIEGGRAFMQALDRARPSLGADHRVQLRWETFAFEALEAVKGWLEGTPQPVLAFNDHTTMTADKLARGQHEKLADWASRAGLSVDAYLALFESVWARRDEVEEAVERLAAHARDAGVVMLSHDDRAPDERRYFRDLGASVAEFPISRAAAAEARAAGEHTVFGAPNVVRGGSHNGSLCAAEMVGAGTCTVLASDYYYPAMAAAVARLMAEREMDLADVWPLISQAPAEALRLGDRGRIAPGLRADVVLAHLDEDGGVSIDATIANGRLVHLAGHERIVG